MPGERERSKRAVVADRRGEAVRCEGLAIARSPGPVVRPEVLESPFGSEGQCGGDGVLAVAEPSARRPGIN